MFKIVDISLFYELLIFGAIITQVKGCITSLPGALATTNPT